MAFAAAHGMPERIQAVGCHSCIVTDLVRDNLLDLEASTLKAPLHEVSMARWIIFDRCADLLTPLMSQLTLEGRLDDLQATSSRTGWLPPERDAGTFFIFRRYFDFERFACCLVPQPVATPRHQYCKLQSVTLPRYLNSVVVWLMVVCRRCSFMIF